MPIFGPSKLLTNEVPVPPPPPRLPKRLLTEAGQPCDGIACFSVLKRSVAPLGDEASAAAEPSKAGNDCSKATLVPSGLSPTDLLICPRTSGESCSRIMFRILIEYLFYFYAGGTHALIYC